MLQNRSKQKYAAADEQFLIEFHFNPNAARETYAVLRNHASKMLAAGELRYPGYLPFERARFSEIVESREFPATRRGPPQPETDNSATDAR